MKRNTSQPVILPLPAVLAERAALATIPFPGRDEPSRRGHSRRRAGRRQRDEGPDSPLGQMRDRLFKMIVANEWDRSHGHRAS